MKKIILDKKGICDYQQNRDPYLFIDYATEIIPGQSAKGYKDLSENEWFFKVHWPNDPNMPGMLQIESLVQMCALSILCLPNNKGKVVYLTAANNMKFIKKFPQPRIISAVICINNLIAFAPLQLIYYSPDIICYCSKSFINNLFFKAWEVQELGKPC